MAVLFGMPDTEIRLKIGGDKGGGSLKMNFQIVTVESSNSPQNTCVFACFGADTTINLHVGLDRFKTDIESLNGMNWKYIYTPNSLP